MKYLTEAEEKRLLKTVREIKGKKAERDYMILFLGFNTGLRLSEIIGLNVGDVRNKEKLYVRPEMTKRTRKAQGAGEVGHKKRAVGRYIPINVKLQAGIKRFIKLKLTWREGIQDDAPLLISKNGGRLSRRSLQEMFEDWRDRAGIEGGYTVHSMRHTFARRILERSPNPYKSLPAVQKLLGHASLASTGVYIEAGSEEMQEAVEAL
jgi:integrase/recombinase XerC